MEYADTLFPSQIPCFSKHWIKSGGLNQYTNLTDLQWAGKIMKVGTLGHYDKPHNHRSCYEAIFILI